MKKYPRVLRTTLTLVSFEPCLTPLNKTGASPTLIDGRMFCYSQIQACMMFALYILLFSIATLLSANTIVNVKKIHFGHSHACVLISYFVSVIDILKTYNMYSKEPIDVGCGAYLVDIDGKRSFKAALVTSHCFFNY